MLWNDLARTADALGADGAAYRRGIGALARDWSLLEADILAPVGIPSHPIAYTRFALAALLSAQAYANRIFSTERARALLAGSAAHSIVPFSYIGSAAISLVLSAVGHARGWPVARGGSQSSTRRDSPAAAAS